MGLGGLNFIIHKCLSESPGDEGFKNYDREDSFKVEFSAININSSKKTIIKIIDYHLTHDKIRKKKISS